jgi:hypothetical protein
MQSSVKDHPKFAEIIAMLKEGTHSTRFIASKLGVKRVEVCAINRVVAMKGNI